MSKAFGIDIGGGSLKGALIDLQTGKLEYQQIRIETPQPATPAAVSTALVKLLKQANITPDIPVGACFPAPLSGGKVKFIANLDASWVNQNPTEVFSKATGRPVYTVNDADAAGVAEATFGNCKNPGVVFFITLGTGIGTAIFNNGVLLPNTELGHLELDGCNAEKRAAASIRTKENLSFSAYAERLGRYLHHLEMLFSPDLFVLGGGISTNYKEFVPLMQLNTPVLPAKLFNDAGVIGAATYGAQNS